MSYSMQKLIDYMPGYEYLTPPFNDENEENEDDEDDWNEEDDWDEEDDEDEED